MVPSIKNLIGKTLFVFNLLLLAVVAGTAVQAQDRAGAVYVMTNQLVNSVAVFQRAADGSLTPAGTFLTGGTGFPLGNPNDPLASEGSLIMSEDNNILFVVNAGSDEISVLGVQQNGLVLLDKVPSGGHMPVSLTVHKNLLYVLNAGGEPNITGFLIQPQGQLTPLPGSTRPLAGGAAAGAAEVAFSPDGGVLIVTEKFTNIIDSYVVGPDGLATGPTATASSGVAPFGFAFSIPDIFVVSEFFLALPAQGAASSYRVNDSGAVQTVTASVHDFQTAPCWVVVTENHRFAFVTNTFSGTISSYSVAADGTLTLLNPQAAMPGPTSAPIDMALINGSRYLYALLDGNHGVVGYRIEADGSLVQVANVEGLPPAAQGISAK